MSVNTKCFFTVILWIFLLVIFILMRQSKKAMKKCFVYLILFVVFCVVSVPDLMPKGLYYHVVDGDSLEYGSVRIRLKDIDAPELFQYCFDKDNKKYYCGKEAHRFLQEIAAGDVRCEYFGKDKYGRQLAECFDDNNNSINKQMVASGMALSYGKKYKKEEGKAKYNKKGIWQGRFIRPELYRALQKKTENTNKIKKCRDSC